MSDKKVMKLASRSKRFGAGVIDFVIPFVAYLVFIGVLAANGLKYSPYNDFGYGYGYGYGYDFGYNYGSRLSGGSAAVLAIISLMLIAYVVVEFVFYAKGKSIGKAILGLQVVSSTNGKPFSFWRMMFREILVKQASGVLMLGFIWILVDEKNRGWHDKILDSYVVDLKESEKMNLKKKLERTEEMAYKAERTATPKEEPAPAPEKPAEKAETEVKDSETPAAAAAVKAAEPVKEELKKEEPEIEIETITIPEAAAVVEEIAEKAKEEAKEEVKIPAVSMAMKKDELLAAAKEAGVKVGSKATKAEIIEAIEKASEE
ncbi:MAG: RDD family protein [Mogibacterium sp.]|nr:RDD family protein [Mogibacterium sp.]